MGGCVDSWETGRRAGGAGRSQGLSAWEKRQNPGASPAPCSACTVVSTAGRGREGRTVPRTASVVMWLAARPARGAMTLPLPLFSRLHQEPVSSSQGQTPRAQRPWFFQLDQKHRRRWRWVNPWGSRGETSEQSPRWTYVHAGKDSSFRKPGLRLQAPSFQRGIHLPKTWPQPWPASTWVRGLGKLSVLHRYTNGPRK